MLFPPPPLQRPPHHSTLHAPHHSTLRPPHHSTLRPTAPASILSLHHPPSPAISHHHLWPACAPSPPPADHPLGTCTVTSCSFNFTSCSQASLSMFCDTYAGQSGSPMFNDQLQVGGCVGWSGGWRVGLAAAWGVWGVHCRGGQVYGLTLPSPAPPLAASPAYYSMAPMRLIACFVVLVN